MTAKLFRVTLTCDTVVCAGSEAEARDVASRDLTDIADWDWKAFEFSADQVHGADDLPPGWDANCQPWGETQSGIALLRELLGKAP